MTMDPTAIGIDFARGFRSVVEVKPKPGEENEQCVFFCQTINDDGDGSDRPEESGKQSDFYPNQLVSEGENDNRGQASEDDIR